MAPVIVGLKTHIWNNNLKSMLFLLTYPILITATYAGLVFVVILIYLLESRPFPATNQNHQFIETFSYTHAVIMEYWYIPYVLIFLYLLVVYFYEKNRLDLYGDKQIVTRETNPEIYSLLEDLCISRGITTPYLFIKDTPHVNAYTSGMTDHTYYIVLTQGLVDALSKNELECVIAHELTHIINRDTRLIYLTGTITHIFQKLYEIAVPGRTRWHGSKDFGRIYMFRMLIALIFKVANIGAIFAWTFISRKREFIADAGALELTKNPEGMISALKKIKSLHLGISPVEPKRRPLLIHYYNMADWFSTHPPIDKRIEVLGAVSRVDPDDVKIKLGPWERNFVRKTTRSLYHSKGETAQIIKEIDQIASRNKDIASRHNSPN